MTVMTKASAPTLLDVARAAGVSRTTVSNAFNRPDQLSAELRDRVLEIAKDLGYPGPNPMARILRTGKAGAIGLVFPDHLIHALTDPATLGLVQGIAQVCDVEETGLLMLSAIDEDAAGRTVAQAAVDGFIIHCLIAEPAVIDSVLGRGVPVVAVEHGGAVKAPSVDLEERAGARAAAEHLLALGHRRFGILSLDTRPGDYVGPLDAARRAEAVYGTTLDRLAGYEAALAAAGIDPAAVAITEVPCYQPQRATASVGQLLARPERPTALLAMSDMLALAAIEAARAQGLSVPRDLSVVGFDDVPRAAEAGLTTVRQPLVEKGRIAAEILFGRRPGAQRIMLPTELVVRGTTAPPSA
jgi:DNA-binding LacI/PurR family transcriptional regulator